MAAVTNFEQYLKLTGVDQAEMVKHGIVSAPKKNVRFLKSSKSVVAVAGFALTRSSSTTGEKKWRRICKCHRHEGAHYHLDDQSEFTTPSGSRDLSSLSRHFNHQNASYLARWRRFTAGRVVVSRSTGAKSQKSTPRPPPSDSGDNKGGSGTRASPPLASTAEVPPGLKVVEQGTGPHGHTGRRPKSRQTIVRVPRSLRADPAGKDIEEAVIQPPFAPVNPAAASEMIAWKPPHIPDPPQYASWLKASHDLHEAIGEHLHQAPFRPTVSIKGGRAFSKAPDYIYPSVWSITSEMEKLALPPSAHPDHPDNPHYATISSRVPQRPVSCPPEVRAPRLRAQGNPEGGPHSSPGLTPSSSSVMSGRRDSGSNGATLLTAGEYEFPFPSPATFDRSPTQRHTSSKTPKSQDLNKANNTSRDAPLPPSLTREGSSSSLKSSLSTRSITSGTAFTLPAPTTTRSMRASSSTLFRPSSSPSVSRSRRSSVAPAITLLASSQRRASRAVFTSPFEKTDSDSVWARTTGGGAAFTF